MRVVLPERPNSPEVVLQFELTQTVDFRRGDEEPRRERVDPPKTIKIEKSVDLRDVHGEIGTRGRTELDLTRDAGFRAGEWSLRVAGPKGPIGAPVDLTLDGVNDDSNQ